MAFERRFFGWIEGTKLMQSSSERSMMTESVQNSRLARRYGGRTTDSGVTVLDCAGGNAAAVDDGVMVEDDDLWLGDSSLVVCGKRLRTSDGGWFLGWLGLGRRVSDRARHGR